MDKATRLKELRESTGMNRKEFCEFFGIPYRTMTEWERDNRHAPDYVIRLLDYYIRVEKMADKHRKGSSIGESKQEKSVGNTGYRRK